MLYSTCSLIGSIFSCAFRFIYTGSIEVNLEIAQDLLKAADQYLLDGLKRLCEYAIAQVGRPWNLFGNFFLFSVLPVSLMDSRYLFEGYLCGKCLPHV